MSRLRGLLACILLLAQPAWPSVPDVALWFIASATLSLVRGAAKVVILARSAG